MQFTKEGRNQEYELLNKLSLIYALKTLRPKI